MSGGTIATGNSITPRRRGAWAGERGLDAARGLAFVGLAFAEAGLILALILELSCAIFVYPLLFVPPTLLAVRRLANLVRRLSGEWRGVPIPVPCRAYREPDPGAGRWPRFEQAGAQLVTEPATWRDLLWMTLDPLLIWLLPFIPFTVIAWGLFGVLMPAYWNPLTQAGGNNWYAFIQVTNWLTAVLSVPLGFAFIALGLWITPSFLRWYGQSARSMLAPTKQAGRSNAAIAQRMVITERAVAKHTSSIFIKLGLHPPTMTTGASSLCSPTSAAKGPPRSPRVLPGAAGRPAPGAAGKFGMDGSVRDAAGGEGHR